jgi:hypothetical protein
MPVFASRNLGKPWKPYIRRSHNPYSKQRPLEFDAMLDTRFFHLKFYILPMNPSLISSIKKNISRVSIILDRMVFLRIGGWSVDVTYYCCVYVLVLARPQDGRTHRPSLGHTHTHTHANGHDHDLGKGQAEVSHSSSLFISSPNRRSLLILPNQNDEPASFSDQECQTV